MPRIRLDLDYYDKYNPLAYQLQGPSGLDVQAEHLRLMAWLDMSAVIADPMRRTILGLQRAVIDTGAYLSVFPEKFWQEFDAVRLTRLTLDPTSPPEFRWLSIGGGTYPVEFYRLPVVLRDNRGSHPVQLVAKFTRDQGNLNIPPTIGLRGGAVDVAAVRGEPSVAHKFGQDWWLDF
jgi:hypothetical protein